jgi:hypothetical protein
MRIAAIEGLPPSLKPVALSAGLASKVAGDVRFGSAERPTLADAESDPGLVAHVSPAPAEPLTDGERAEAERTLLRAERDCRPASHALIAYWCGRLRALPNAPQGDHWQAVAVDAIIAGCGDLPGVVWTQEHVTEALRTFERWPSPKQVYDLLRAKARPFLRVRDGLRRAVTAPEPVPAVREAPTPEALAVVQETVRALTGEIRQRAQASHAAEVTAKPRAVMSDGALLAQYERLAAEGDAGARIRVAMLRKRLAEAVP